MKHTAASMISLDFVSKLNPKDAVLRVAGRSNRQQLSTFDEK